MAVPYGISGGTGSTGVSGGITGSTTTTVPDISGGGTATSISQTQVTTAVSGNVPAVAIAQLNNALAQFGNGTSINLTVDTIGGGQTTTADSSTPTVFFENSSSPSTVQLGGSGSQIVVGGAGPISMIGSNAPQTMIGGSGPVTLSAGASGGNHLMEAGAGGSLLMGGIGADTLVGGLYTDSHDTLEAGPGANQTLVVTTGAAQLYSHIGFSDTLSAGTSGNDTLYGTASRTDHTTFNVGNGANATVEGGAGKDSVVVAQGSGLVSINGGGGQNDVTFAGETRGDAHIHTNANSGVTTVRFDNDAHVVKLENVQTIHFTNGGTVHLP